LEWVHEKQKRKEEGGEIVTAKPDARAEMTLKSHTAKDAAWRGKKASKWVQRRKWGEKRGCRQAKRGKEALGRRGWACSVTLEIAKTGRKTRTGGQWKCGPNCQKRGQRTEMSNVKKS